MGNEPEIAFDQDIAGFQIPLGCQGKIVFLFRFSQGLWETSGLQLQRIEQAAQHKPKGSGHSLTSMA
jgi:hypothetical protein